MKVLKYTELIVKILLNYYQNMLTGLSKANWYSESNIRLISSLIIDGTDRVGVIDDITKIISSQLKVNMKSINVDLNEGIFNGKIELFVSDTLQLSKLIKITTCTK